MSIHIAKSFALLSSDSFACGSSIDHLLATMGGRVITIPNKNALTLYKDEYALCSVSKNPIDKLSELTIFDGVNTKIDPNTKEREYWIIKTPENIDFFLKKSESCYIVVNQSHAYIVVNENKEKFLSSTFLEEDFINLLDESSFEIINEFKATELISDTIGILESVKTLVKMIESEKYDLDDFARFLMAEDDLLEKIKQVKTPLPSMLNAFIESIELYVELKNKSVYGQSKYDLENFVLVHEDEIVNEIKSFYCEKFSIPKHVSSNTNWNAVFHQDRKKYIELEFYYPSISIMGKFYHERGQLT